MHFGFLDPNACLGRRYASVGLSIKNFDLKFLSFPSISSQVVGEFCTPEIKAKTLSLISALQNHFGHKRGMTVKFESFPPRHCGFGTGTQLALATAKSFCYHNNLPFSSNNLSQIIGRGNRSGIGIGAFKNGGFLIDGGKGNYTYSPPVLVQKKFPNKWKILLILDPTKVGLHGDKEKEAIKQLPEFEEKLSSHLCHEILLRVLPAVIEKDFKAFVIGLNQIQKIMGNYFSTAQGGSAYLSLQVKEIIDWLETRYNVAVGQSSWGPTGFVFFENESLLSTAIKQLKKGGLINDSLKLAVSQASNVGAKIEKVKGFKSL